MSSDDFRNRTRTLRALRSAMGLLGWDQETYMPAGASEARGETMGELALLLHQQVTDPGWVAWLREKSASSLSPESARRADLLLREAERKLLIPGSLEAELASTASQAQHAWAKARAARDSAAYLPWFRRLVDLKRQEAACLRPSDGEAWDGLLDGFEPGMRAKNLEPVFSELVAGISSMLSEIPAGKVEQPKVAIGLQETYCRGLLGRMGFSSDTGRLDVSAHPFTEGLAATDVRLTVRYKENAPFESITSLLHEGGHGLYEQGVASHWGFGDPLSEAISLGVHESQSRFWENCIGRSDAFWQGEAAHVKKDLGLDLKPSAIGSMLRGIRPGFIRVDADEVCYNLHIVLRFRLERALIEGELAPDEVEGAWNEGMKTLLGIVPTNVAEGWMQDVHWSAGLFGYFPTYTLGNLYSAQLLTAIRKDLGDLDVVLAAGGLGKILDWLRNKVHAPGRRWTAGELMQQVTGRPLAARDFLDYLHTRYS